MRILLVLMFAASPTWAADCDKYLNGSTEWKLIRDYLPERFVEEGTEYTVDQVLDPEDIKHLLLRKLDEEVKEFAENPSLEEMADIEEVLAAIRTRFGLKAKDVTKLQKQKRELKGGFESGFVMKLGSKKE